MEKLNIEKIFNNYSDSSPISAIPKRLSYDLLNNSTERASKKRKLSENDSGTTLNSSKNDKSFSNDSSSFNLTSMPSSPWEHTRMKADLIESKSRVTLLKKEIEHLNTVSASTELKYRHQISSLEKQNTYNTNKISDLEKHLSVIRKRENATREELVKCKNSLNIQKQSYDDQVYQLQRDYNELEETFTETCSDLKSEVRELNQQISETDEQLSMTKEELENYKQINETLQDKADNYDKIKKELDELREKYTESESKIKALEYEVGSYGDWKNLSKVSHQRIANYKDLEKEVHRLREETKNLHDIIGNKMLLEEQVTDLKTRLEHYEKNNTDVVSLKVQITELEKQLNEWKKVANDFSTNKAITAATITPIILRSQYEQILQKDLILANEKSSVKNEKTQIENEITGLRVENEQLIRQSDELKKTLKQYQTALPRLQKKLTLITRERDCWKQLLDNYEKDLTITSSSALNNPDSQIRARIEMLEKTVGGYKELCAKLETELQENKNLPDLALENALNNEQYEILRKEIMQLTSENEKLRKRKNELELEMDNHTLRAEINRGLSKVVHLVQNPADEAYAEHANEIEKLQAEIERLKLKVKKLEEGNEEMTMRLNDTNMTMNIKEVNTLKAQIQSLESKNQHIKEVYKAAALEFREVCYMLFGYRIDRVGNTNYRISSMYAESADEYLNFNVNENGSVLNMLETQYSISLGDMMQTHLASHGSFPAFLSTLTLELFNRTTVMMKPVQQKAQESEQEDEQVQELPQKSESVVEENETVKEVVEKIEVEQIDEQGKEN
uniref:Putative attachment n=1 Tax=Corethrella appendiculata TaxID=1370023 RepID=U5EX09_9DIPT